MTNPRGRMALRALFGTLALSLLLGLVITIPAAAQSPLPRRAVIPGAATDGIPVQEGPTLPAPDPAYCTPPGGPGSTPPSSILGLITIGGQPAPVNTILQLVIGGKLGPADYVKQAGGYRIDYAAGAQGCSNQAGATIAVFVNGQVVETGVKVGDEAANPFLRFDIQLP